MDNIHDLKLNETIHIDNGTFIIRVPGYWVYVFKNGSSQKIPYSTEFNNKKPKILTKELLTLIISSYLNIPNDFYYQKTKKGKRAEGKKILVKILYENLNMKYDKIASFMRYKTHAAPLAALKRMNEILMFDTEYKRDYKEILRQLLKYKE